MIGYSKDWESFTLSEAVKLHFDNDIGNVGPVLFINVLNPELHKKETETSHEATFVNGQAIIISDKIILDTLKLDGKTADVDYTVRYDYNLNRVVLESDTITGTVTVTYSEVDTKAIDKSMIIGKVDVYKRQLHRYIPAQRACFL